MSHDSSVSWAFEGSFRRERNGKEEGCCRKVEIENWGLKRKNVVWTAM